MERREEEANWLRGGGLGGQAEAASPKPRKFERTWPGRQRNHGRESLARKKEEVLQEGSGSSRGKLGKEHRG